MPDQFGFQLKYPLNIFAVVSAFYDIHSFLALMQPTSILIFFVQIEPPQEPQMESHVTRGSGISYIPKIKMVTKTDCYSETESI